MHVPTHLHRYWIGPRRPPYIDDFEDAWRQLHPHWQVTTWTDESLPVSALKLAEMVEDRCSHSSRIRHRANCVRYWLLFEFGGVWADTDICPLRPIDPLLENAPFTASLRGAAEGALLGGPPRSDFFGALVHGLISRQRSGNSALVSGASYLEEVRALHPEVVLLPAARVFTHDALGRRIHGLHYTRHLWASSRYVEGSQLAHE